jgi:hypothetical protein
MAAVAWSWRQRIRRRHFTHYWTMRLLSDSALECPVCHWVKPDPRPRHLPPVPRADELDIIKENHVLAVAQRVLKGLAAAASAGIASYGVAVTDGRVTAEEWITLAVAAIGAGLIVWAVPNRKPV